MQHASASKLSAQARRVAISAAVALLASSVSSAGTEANTCTDKPYVVKIHADWCGTCKTLAPLWEQINASLGDRARVVDFDVTDRAAYEKSRAEAKRLGIIDFFERYKKRTGTIAVLDCKTLEPVEVLRGESDLSKVRDAVARASRSS